MTTPAAARTDEDGARFYPIPDGTGEVHRLTNISGVLDVLHSFGLTDWKVVNSVVGIAHRADLQARIIAAHNLPDPKERKRELKLIASDAVDAGQCLDPAKGYLANDFGTAIHLLTELVDAGNVSDLFAMPGIVRGQVAAYIDTITAHGIETVMSEFTVYSFGHGYAGTLDRMWRFTRTEHNAAAFDEYDLGRGCFGADTKTGSIYPKVAMQLAAAVNAEGVYDAATGERSPLPDDVRTDLGFVLQLSGDKAKLVPVDLTAAWPAFTGALAVKAFDVTKPLGKALPHVRTEVEPPHAAPTVTAAAEVTAPPAVTSAAPISPDAPAEISKERWAEHLELIHDTVASAAEHVANATRRKSLLEKRMSMDPATVEALRDVWPADVPGLPTDHVHTAAELDLIEEAISKVWPAFPEPDPAHEKRHIYCMFRLDELPSDLQAIVRGLCDFGTTPAHALTPQRMAHLEAMLTEAEATYTERTTRISAAMAALGPDLELAALSVIGVSDLDAFTAWELDQLELLAAHPDALGEQPKGWTKDHGKAERVVGIARASAKELHRPVPRSAADVLSDPILVAAVAVAGTATPTTTGEATA